MSCWDVSLSGQPHPTHSNNVKMYTSKSRFVTPSFIYFAATTICSFHHHHHYLLIPPSLSPPPHSTITQPPPQSLLQHIASSSRHLTSEILNDLFLHCSFFHIPPPILIALSKLSTHNIHLLALNQIATLLAVLCDVREGVHFPVNVQDDKANFGAKFRNKNSQIASLLEKLNSTSLNSSSFWNSLLRLVVGWFKHHHLSYTLPPTSPPPAPHFIPPIFPTPFQLHPPIHPSPPPPPPHLSRCHADLLEECLGLLLASKEHHCNTLTNKQRTTLLYSFPSVHPPSSRTSLN